MIRKIDPFGRITISYKWLKEQLSSTVVVSVEEGKIVIQPYDPKKHDLNVQLNRRLDDHARIKLSPDIFRAAGLPTTGTFNIFVAPDNNVWIRKVENYCDACGKEAKTQPYKRKNLCQDCFEKFKQCE